jgi:hypothetical protein
MSVQNSSTVQNSLTQLNTPYLNSNIDLSTGNQITLLRTAKENCETSLVNNARKLDQLRYEESLIKTNIYNLYEQYAIDNNFKAGAATTLDPNQSSNFTDVNVSGPNQAIHYNLALMEYNQPGLKELKTSLDNIDHKINTLNDKIKEDQAKLKDINAKLDSANGVKQQDLANDKIATSIYAYENLLFQLSKQYRILTTDASTGKRGYPSNDEKLTKDVVGLLKAFKATALSLPALTTKLDFSDPGSDANQKILSDAIGFLLKVNKINNNEIFKQDTKTANYIAQIQAVAQDPGASQNILRRNVPAAPTGNSFAEVSASYSKTNQTLYVNYFKIGFKTKNALESVLQRMKTNQSKTYLGLPPCEPPVQTDAEAAQQMKDFSNEQAMAAGVKSYKKSLSQALGIQNTTEIPTYTDWLDYVQKNDPVTIVGQGSSWVVPGTYVQTIPESAQFNQNVSVLTNPVYNISTSTYYYVTAGWGTGADAAYNSSVNEEKFVQSQNMSNYPELEAIPHVIQGDRIYYYVLRSQPSNK